MRIALLGYGKMGKMVERVARESDHEIVQVVDPLVGSPEIEGPWLEATDVMIDFSVAEAVPGHVEGAVRAGIPVVVGTTGWDAQLEGVRKRVESAQGACVYSSNFSMGVQALFYLAAKAGELMSRFAEYHPFIWESHHVQKVDAPSGTALTLGRILQKNYTSKIPVCSLRAGFFPGEHRVGFDSPVDTLVLQHSARSREGFARGALFAGQWIQGKTGFYSFEQVLFGEENG